MRAKKNSHESQMKRDLTMKDVKVMKEKSAQTVFLSTISQTGGQLELVREKVADALK